MATAAPRPKFALGQQVTVLGYSARIVGHILRHGQRGERIVYVVETPDGGRHEHTAANIAA